MKTAKGLVSVIIVNWNGREHLAKCLPSLFGQDYRRIEVVVVDNGSTDGSVEFLKSKYPQVKIVRNKENLGFAPANNQGYQVGTGEYVLFLNNDTRVTKNFLTELLKVISTSRTIGGVQSKLLLMNHPKQLDSVGSFLTYSGFLYHWGVFAKDSPKYNRQMPVYSAKGACMLFRREVLEEVKVAGEVLDGAFFAYFEETDMCHRVWLAGYRILYVPTSVVYHKFGATSIRLFKPFVEFHSYKNRINSYIKNLGARKLAVLLPTHLVICEALSLIFIFKGSLPMFGAIQKAIFWNLLNLKTTLKKRKYIQTVIRQVKDDIIFSTNLLARPKADYYLANLSGWGIERKNAEKNKK